MKRLELRPLDSLELWYHLDDRPVHPGHDLELLLEGGHWIRGRFEWDGQRANRPTFQLTCGGPWESLDAAGDTIPLPSEIGFALPRDALLRWPRNQ